MPSVLPPAAAAAVASLTAAGGDVDALAAAISKATFLDEAPGDGRQALRGEGERRRGREIRERGREARLLRQCAVSLALVG